jgi:hypothetical protein
VFFLLVWKWLICVHESDTLKQLTLLTQKIRSSPALTSFPKQRAVALAAVHTRIIHQIAQRAACRSDDVTLFTDREETDCVLSVLETLSGDSEMSLWAEELAYGVVSQLSCRAEVAIEHLDAISTASQESNKIMSSWMRCAVEAVGAKPPLWLSQYRSSRPELAVPLLTILARDIMTSSTQCVPLVAALVQKRDHLRHFWVIPDVLELYNWLTTELSHSPIDEAVCKKMPVAKLLENAMPSLWKMASITGSCGFG